MESNITKTHDKQHGVWIYDAGSQRAIIYKLGDRWAVRAGKRRPGMIAPESESFQTFGRRKFAQAHAEGWLGQ